MPHYKLYYFPIRAKAEFIRQIFAYAGVEYEDIRIPRDQWKDFKGNTPFGQIPVLEVDERQIPQSHAIARYLASQYGLAGKDAFEAAWVDAIADQIKDYQNEFTPYLAVLFGFREGDKDKLRKEVAEPARDKIFSLLEKRLKESSSGLLVGDSLTWVDLLLAEHVSWVNTAMTTANDDFLDAYPEVVKHSKKIQEIPAIAKWIEKRPFSER